MLLDAEATTHLKPWLVRTLEPICDAEPGALGDYILALLKHNAPEAELRQELNSQLEEFLEKETSSFIDTLFTGLRTKSYIPYSSTDATASTATSSSNAASDGGIPIPLDALMGTNGADGSERGRKRSLEYDDRDYRPNKGPRTSEEGPYSRYGRGGGAFRGERGGGRMMMSGRADYMDGGMNGAMEMGMAGMMNGRSAYRPPERRGICRDYHNNGYCARGAFCKYSHGDDAMVPNSMFPMNGMQAPYGGMLPGGDMPFQMGGTQNAPYNPHERMDMRPLPGGSMGMGTGRVPQGRAPIIHRQDGSISRKQGELPVIQDLTPVSPEDENSAQAQGQTPVNGGPTHRSIPSMVPPPNMDHGIPTHPMGMRNNGFRPGPPRGGGPTMPKGTFGEAPTFRPERRNDKTLVVEKIPEDKLSLGAINNWFQKFGTITNVAVDTNGAKALVSFAEHEEARAAWKSEDAVFGNRFVKVFWHRPLEGHGQLGQRMLAASANIVAKTSTSPAPPPTSSHTPPTASPMRKSASSSTATALAAKQHLLEQQIAEQKALMSKLSTASPEEKKGIMARLRKLNEEMKPPATTAIKTESPPAASTPAKTSRDSTPRTDDQAQKERDRLDKELELLHAASTADGEAEDNTDELRARLAKLKAEAASLGISAETPAEVPQSFNGGGYRPYRGRGRGARGFYRGRGGPPRTSMKLDNRPKKILLKGANSDQVQGVRDWYETTGQLDSVDITEDGDLLVSFKSRSGAEQGLAKGTSIPTVGSVQVSWFTGTAPTAPPPKPATPVADEPPIEPPTMDTSPQEADLHMQEEEVIDGGWGRDDGDDDFGMI